MDDATRHSLLQLLGKAMSDISEECYYAGWLGGTEYFVPELCRRALESGRPQLWGHGEVTPEEARGLTYLADRLGYWADLDDAATGYVPHQPFPIPKEYAEGIDREQVNTPKAP
ncbi:MAG TPA: hypothetical protein VFG68_20475 [Fimbriiglobus sp.]|nr:hypothetical protein [Fimbriiglobus sp.]